MNLSPRVRDETPSCSIERYQVQHNHIAGAATAVFRITHLMPAGDDVMRCIFTQRTDIIAVTVKANRLCFSESS
jgi:hypothetical protein